MATGTVKRFNVGHLSLEPGLGRTWRTRWRGTYGVALPTSAGATPS
jgi:hypothetical protein